MNYPDLKDDKLLSVDTETHDPNLKEMGPGVYRKDGRILGVSLSNGKGFSEYYNLGHYDCEEETKNKNRAYLKDQLKSNTTKLGVNILYDIDGLKGYEDIDTGGKLYDIQVAEPLIDENQGKYSLDFLAQKYLNKGKESNKPIQFCIDNDLPYTGKHDFREHLHRMPYHLVRDYAIGDVDEPFEIFEKQKVIMENEGLTNVFELESELLEVMLMMRRQGTKIDTLKRDMNGLKLQNFIEEKEISLFEQYGTFNYNSTKQVASIFDGLGVPYNRNPKTKNPTIDADYLESIEEQYEIAADILGVKKSKTTLNNFIRGSLVRFITKGDLIHCSFYGTRREDYGTRSGRYSSANPNLQQIPSLTKNERLGLLCRELFIPIDKDHAWGKLDYSQIEYRVLAHFAVGQGSNEVRQQYIDNPNTDYHQYIMNLTKLKRKLAKNLNFGVMFGMGKKTMAKKFGWTLEYCADVLSIYHGEAPYVKATMRKVEEVVSKRGYIKTFLGRRSRMIDKSKSYIFMNRLIQGSAADILKKSMLDTYRAGIYDVLKLHLTVHDELDPSIPKTIEGAEAFLEMKNIMENCVELRVPIVTDMEVGNSWGTVKELHKYNPELKDKKPTAKELLKILQEV